MYNLSFILVLVAGTFSSEAEDKDPFRPEILVQARAIRVEYDPHRPWQKTTFRIEHVYSGDVKLKGTTFEDSFILERGGFSSEPRAELEPPIKQGEEGIWYLIRSDNGGKIIPNIHNQGTHEDDGLVGWSLAVPVPARKIIGGQYNGGFFGTGNHVRYTSALKWAQEVEKVYKTARADRLKVLRENIFSDNPYVAAWSLRILAEYKPRDFVPLLEKLAVDFKLSVGAQVTIDDILGLRVFEWVIS